MKTKLLVSYLVLSFYLIAFSQDKLQLPVNIDVIDSLKIAELNQQLKTNPENNLEIYYQLASIT